MHPDNTRILALNKPRVVLLYPSELEGARPNAKLLHSSHNFFNFFLIKKKSYTEVPRVDTYPAFYKPL